MGMYESMINEILLSDPDPEIAERLRLGLLFAEDDRSYLEPSDLPMWLDTCVVEV